MMTRGSYLTGLFPKGRPWQKQNKYLGGLGFYMVARNFVSHTLLESVVSSSRFGRYLYFHKHNRRPMVVMAVRH